MIRSKDYGDQRTVFIYFWGGIFFYRTKLKFNKDVCEKFYVNIRVLSVYQSVYSDV